MKWHLTTATASPLAWRRERERKSAISQRPPTAGVGVEMREAPLKCAGTRTRITSSGLRLAQPAPRTSFCFLFFLSAPFFLCVILYLFFSFLFTFPTVLFSCLGVSLLFHPKRDPSCRCLRRFFLSGGLRVPDIHVLVCIFSFFPNSLSHKPRIWVRRR